MLRLLTEKKEAYASSRLIRCTLFFNLSFSAPQFIPVYFAVLASLPPKNTFGLFIRFAYASNVCSKIISDMFTIFVTPILLLLLLIFSCRHPLSYFPGIPSLISLSFYSFISSTLPCLPGKDTPRAFGASFRRHAAPRTLVLTFFSLASIHLLRLSRTL